MIDQQTMGAIGANEGGYRDNLAHREHDPYGGSDPYKTHNPYATDDPHAKKERKEKKKPWEMDFRIVRFFRESFNAGIDFEESPRNFFDEEHMLSIRLDLLGRNFKIIVFKFIVMTLFTLGALIMTANGVLIAGAIYTILFLYNIAVPMAFVKYTRQYIMVDDLESGKLRKIHDTYTSWIRPLEVIAMNTFSIIFILFEAFLYFNTMLIMSMFDELEKIIHINSFTKYLHGITHHDIQISILLTALFYLLAYVLYWVFMYKIWGPKWEKQRIFNLKQWTRTNQRASTNMMDEMAGEDLK